MVYALSLVAYMRAHVNKTTYIFVNSMQLNICSTYVLLEIRRGKPLETKISSFSSFLMCFWDIKLMSRIIAALIIKYVLYLENQGM